MGDVDKHTSYEEELNEILSKGSISESDPIFLRELQKTSKKTQTTEEREDNEILDMRKRWSCWVLIFIAIIIIFDIIIVFFYGNGIWKFDNPNVVIAIITENFLKIITLGILITNNIFQKIYKK